MRLVYLNPTGQSWHRRGHDARSSDATLFHGIGAATVAQVNLPVGVLIWLMIVPMLLKIDLGALGAGALVRHCRDGRRQLAGKAFSMAVLGWLFRPLLPAGQIEA